MSLGAIINYGMLPIFSIILASSYIDSAVMVSIVDSQREILLNPLGTNVWVINEPLTCRDSR